jgi:hypothetical protein
VNAYPLPLSVTVVPIGPEDGATPSVAVVPVNSELATFVIVLGSQTTTHGYAPLTSVDAHTIVVPVGMLPPDVAGNVEGEADPPQAVSPDAAAKQ